jgi:hypothetical protein
MSSLYSNKRDERKMESDWDFVKSVLSGVGRALEHVHDFGAVIKASTTTEYKIVVMASKSGEVYLY